MKLHFLTLLAALALAGSPLFAAATRSFPENNVAIDLPDWWEQVSPPPEEALVAIRAPKKSQSLLVLATRRPPHETDDAGETFAALKKSVKAQGYEITDEGPIVSHELTWRTMAARKSGGASLAIWAMMLGDKVYLMRGDNGAGSAIDDPDLHAALYSFRLLSPSPPTAPSVVWRKSTIPMVILGLLLLAGAGLLLFLGLGGLSRRER